MSSYFEGVEFSHRVGFSSVVVVVVVCIYKNKKV